MPIIAVPTSGYGSEQDLVTATYATQVLAAGGVTLTSAQNLVLAPLITAASREIVRWCGRQFALTVYDEILTPEGGRQDRGEPASFKLSAFPIQGITRCDTGRSTALSISNADTVTNQRATVAFAVTGDVEYRDLAYVGLNLTRWAGGTPVVSSLLFAAYPTVNALATAINALGGGWTATVASGGTPSLGLFASTELVGAREPKNAFTPGACLDLFTQAATSYDVDRPTGIVRCYGTALGGGFGGAFGGFWGDGGGDPYGGGLWWNQYRLVYVAGFATVPESVQQVCAELVKLTFERLKNNNVIKTQSGGSEAENWSTTTKDSIPMLPDWALQVLSMYRDNFI